MTLTHWFYFFLIIQVIHFLGTWKLYVKAGRKAWEAAIPIYNAVILMKIINRPTWWTVLLFIPIVNLFMFPVVWVETIRSFKKNTTADTFLVIFTLGFYIYYVNYIANVSYVKNRSLKAPSAMGDWVSSIVFAIVAATLVHTYVMQPYTIPTSSLEKSLLVGDFLFVSKFHYGARVPMTPIAAPMVHDTLPFIKVKSYLANDGKKTHKTSWLNKFSLPYMRVPGFQKIKNNDIVVFSWPVDTVNAFQQYSDGKFHYKPIDKKSNYVKRCVGIAGDSLQIINGKVHINGKPLVLPERAKPQFMHTVITDGTLSGKTLTDVYKIKEGNALSNTKFILNLTEELANRLKNNPAVKSITRNNTPAGSFKPRVFPHNEQYPWSQDNFGPIYIPEAGKTVTLNSKSIPFYKRIIEAYEHNNLTINGDDIYINGKLADSYTFKQNYYWLMGDNRHNSEDARYWGYVPFDHVVGKPVFIWMSWDGLKPRWERFFTTVGGDGKPFSYRWIFLGFVALWFGYNFYKKRKEA